ncbi:MAG: hypothetical protein MUO18_02900 [Methanomassiliicoccales archaeon]|jgi:protein-arginine kinase activator protein McsA|nr:hypothetical protein [Methanomassiliicoccales archaeon]
MKCENCGREMVLENYFVENRLVKGEKVEVAICNRCYYANWNKAEARKWERSGSG